MKKIFTLITAIAVTFGFTQRAIAEEISYSDAMQTARAVLLENTHMKLSANTPMQCVYSLQSTTGVALYVFTPEEGEGFAIVAGNDVAAPVIGFSDQGTFDPNNIPPNMANMLAGYQRQINYGIANGLSPRGAINAATDPKEPVAMICQAKWDQDAPYWNMCPTRYGSRCYTGCVATAMAQVMKVYEWPKKGKGYGLGSFSSNSLAHTYDWANMLNVYGSSYTSAQGNAVAQLMVDCGYSVDMSYSTSGSGANTDEVPNAFVNNFSYDKAIDYIHREQYSETEWNDLMYYQLKNGWPILYGGFASDGGGHQFIADGYKKGGYYHINWGWGGTSDGYFLLSALDPYTQGAGGANSGFNTGQDAVTFIRLPRENSVRPTTIDCPGNFVKSSASGNTVTFGVTSGSLWGMTMNGFINLGGTSSITATMGILAIPADNPQESVIISASGSTTFKKWSTKLSSYQVSVANLPNGTYYLFPYSKANTSDQWQRVKATNGKQQYVVLKRNGDTNIFSSPSGVKYNPVYTIYMPDTIKMNVNDTYTLAPTVLPADGTNTNVAYSLTDKSLGNIDQTTGVISSTNKKGTTILTTAATDGSKIQTQTVLIIDDLGVSNLEADDPNAPKDVYNMMGICLIRNASPEQINALPQGLYIIGGKKVIIR